MQPLAIYHLRNLLRSHPSVLTCKAVKYGFFNFHMPKLRIIQKQKEKKPKLFLSTRNPTVIVHCGCILSVCFRLLYLFRYVGWTKPCHRAVGSGFTPEMHQNKKGLDFSKPSSFERKTRVCPSAPRSVYQAITFAQYYTPYSRDTWVVSGCRFRVRLLPYKLQNYSCLRQIYE